MKEEGDVIESVRKALGRTVRLIAPPVPPVIDEPIVRLVQTDIGLAELFARVASENKMSVLPVSPDELADQVVAFLQKNKIKTVAMTVSPLLKALGIFESIRQAGIEVRTWDELQLDQVYDIDCGITDVWAAVAEVGGLVIHGTVDHGRAVSLVPAFHIAIVQPKDLVGDLVDLFQKIPPDQNDKFVIITGPSKTADIEMNLVTGVHGPGVVQVFLLQ